MSYDQSALNTFRVWKHLRRGGLYHVIGLSLDAGNGGSGTPCVVYFSITNQNLYHRPLSEFLDGRFEPVPPAG